MAEGGWWIGLVVALLGLWLIWRWATVACDRANGADWGARWLNRLDGLVRLFCQHYHHFEFQRIPVPERGGALIAANHVSGLDPILLLAACPRPLRFMVATEEYRRWWLRWLYKRLGFIPVDRSGAPEKAFYAARRALNEGELIGVFPQGRIKHAGDPHTPLKRGVAVLARLADVPIMPVRVHGIGGVGRTVAAVFIRSEARLEAGQPIDVADGSDDENLARLKAFIEHAEG